MRTYVPQLRWTTNVLSEHVTIIPTYLQLVMTLYMPAITQRRRYCILSNETPKLTLYCSNCAPTIARITTDIMPIKKEQIKSKKMFIKFSA